MRPGAGLGLDLGPMFGLRSGTSYSQKGASAPDGAGGLAATLDLAYLEVPLLVSVHIPTGPSPVMPRLYAGGSANFELSCDQVVEGEQEFSQSCEDAGLSTESTDFGLLFGGGLDVRAGPGAFTVDARQDLGLTDIAGVQQLEQPEI